MNFIPPDPCLQKHPSWRGNPRRKQPPPIPASQFNDLRFIGTWSESHMGQGPVLFVGCFLEYEPNIVWMFPKIGVPQNGWCIMENPFKMDDLGVPPFSETSIYEPATFHQYCVKSGFQHRWKTPMDPYVMHNPGDDPNNNLTTIGSGAMFELIQLEFFHKYS